MRPFRRALFRASGARSVPHAGTLMPATRRHAAPADHCRRSSVHPGACAVIHGPASVYTPRAALLHGHWSAYRRRFSLFSHSCQCQPQDRRDRASRRSCGAARRPAIAAFATQRSPIFVSWHLRGDVRRLGARVCAAAPRAAALPRPLRGPPTPAAAPRAWRRAAAAHTVVQCAQPRRLLAQARGQRAAKCSRTWRRALLSLMSCAL